MRWPTLDCRRQILTCKDSPRTERIKIFIVAVGRSIQMKTLDIYDDFKLKKAHGLHGYTKAFHLFKG